MLTPCLFEGIGERLLDDSLYSQGEAFPVCMGHVRVKSFDEVLRELIMNEIRMLRLVQVQDFAQVFKRNAWAINLKPQRGTPVNSDGRQWASVEGVTYRLNPD